jgi:SAM-dependent methyltransferase
MRSIVHLVSDGLFGKSLALDDFPRRKDLRGVGLSDWDEYARRLADRLDYTNTYYHQEPQLDITRIAPEAEHSCDFIISTDVFEHVEPPVSRAFEGARRLLKPGGLLVLTVPFTIESDQTLEHFPELHDWKLVQRDDGGYTVHNRRRDGTVEEFPHPVFHGGPGTTLEMRVFSRESLLRDLRNAGFSDIRVADEPVPEFGIHWPVTWSLPIVARA